MTSFFCVHGAFQGGWVWRQIKPYLEKQGCTVHRPTLSGCGYLYQEPQTPAEMKDYLMRTASYMDTVSGFFQPPRDQQYSYNLVSYIKDIESYLALEDLHDVVLVGHSFSGMICSALLARVPERFRSAIFIDAVIPCEGKSFVDIAGPQFEKMLEQHRLGNGLVKPWPLPVFGVNGLEADWFGARLRPFPRAAFHTVFPEKFDSTICPISYISCRQTMSPFIRETANTARRLGWPVHELDSSHCPMVTCPQALAEMLIALVR